MGSDNKTRWHESSLYVFTEHMSVSFFAYEWSWIRFLALNIGHTE